MACSCRDACVRLRKVHHASPLVGLRFCMSGVRRISIERGDRPQMCGILRKHFKAPRCTKSFGTTALPMGLPSELFMTQDLCCYTGGPNAVSAELLSSAQQKLQEAYPGVPPPEMLSGARISGQQAEVQHLKFGILSRVSVFLVKRTFSVPTESFPLGCNG